MGERAERREGDDDDDDHIRKGGRGEITWKTVAARDGCNEAAMRGGRERRKCFHYLAKTRMASRRDALRYRVRKLIQQGRGRREQRSVAG